MPPDGPNATPAPIHDIVGPVPILESPVWWITAAVCAAGLLAVFLLMLVRQLKIPPYQLAVELSDILRSYLEEFFGIRVTTATSLEFLESIQNSPLFSEQEKRTLAAFLETVDLLKFARVEAGEEETKKLLQGAEEIARGSLLPPAAALETKGDPV